MEDHPSALKYDFHDPAFYNNPYPYYRRMQQEDPLWHNPISGHWVVTRYHDVMEILHSPQCSNYRLDELMRRMPDNRNDEAASLRAALKDRLLFLEGEGHLRIRKLVMHAFASDSIQRQKPLVAEVVEDIWITSIRPVPSIWWQMRLTSCLAASSYTFSVSRKKSSRK